LQRIEIVGADRDEFPSAAEVLVEFILEVDKGRIGCWREGLCEAEDG
jgi:hypothetical protein